MDDYVELAAFVLGVRLAEDDTAVNVDAVEKALTQKWGIYLDEFEGVARALLRCTYPTPSPITGKLMHLFGSTDKESGAFIAIMREEMSE